MSDGRQQFAAVARALVILSPERFAWCGAASERLPSSLRPLLKPADARRHLVSQISSQLYRDFYLPGSPRPSTRRDPDPSSARALPMIQDLSRANCGRGYAEPGWRVRDAGTSGIRVRRDGLQLEVSASDCLVPPGAAPAPGMIVALRFPKGFPWMSPGFYLAAGDAPAPGEWSRDLLRFYWNLTAGAAVPLMRAATRELNRAGLAFRLKILTDPAGFVRCDAGVLYVNRADYPAAADRVAGVYRQVASALKPAVPSLTKGLAPGLGFAEGPGSGDSFGLNRCQLLAEGALRGYERGARAFDDRLRSIEEWVSGQGVDLERPFLNRGSSDVYACVAAPRRRRPASVEAPARASGAGRYLEAAATLGNGLCAGAVWSAGRCNWMGFTAAGAGAHGGGKDLIYAALGPELYAGTSGVALYLAELYRETGDPRLRRAAHGAVRQALGRAGSLSPRHQLGLHTGKLGIAFAAAQVGLLTGADAPVAAARRLLAGLGGRSWREAEYDYLSGIAGAIVGLIALAADMGEPPLLEFADRLGKALVGRAVPSRRGLSWRSPSKVSHRNLTGMSHGASGAGYALSELHQATGDRRFQAAAEGAFAYERSWFDAEACNWPDFRKHPGERLARGSPAAFSSAWCHGAPGIALARIRAWQIFGGAVLRGEAAAALSTTRRAVERGLSSGTENYSLCHGLGGNAEALLFGREVLGGDLDGERALALAAADAGIARYGESAEAWPCGTGGGQNPGLMVGLAGIGLFYLRLHNAAVPSVLTPIGAARQSRLRGICLPSQPRPR